MKGTQYQTPFPNHSLSSSLLKSKKLGFHIVQHSSADEESQLRDVSFYRTSRIKFALYVLLSVGSGGLFYLLCRWFNNMFILMNYVISEPEVANVAHVKGINNSGLSKVLRFRQRTVGDVIIFYYRLLPYRVDGDVIRPVVFPSNRTRTEVLTELAAGIQDDNTVSERRQLYGACAMDLPRLSNLKILLNETLNPFYIFQMFAVALWTWDEYYYYAASIFIISVFSALINFVQTRKNWLQIHSMAEYSCPITVIRSQQEYDISSSDLVPGDLFRVPEGVKMPCDAVLIHGTAVVNESNLTGESAPILKDPLTHSRKRPYSVEHDKRHSLYEGTELVQIQDQPLAVVTRTGFLTIKGQLIRSIIFPKPNRFAFYKDSIRFLVVMFILALAGLAVILPKQISNGLNVEDMVDRSLDMITITVPPALPAAMTIGVAFALNRLKRQSIFCIAPPRVNMAGQVSTFVFDKTGTLTKNGMSLHRIIPSHSADTRVFQENMATWNALVFVQGEIKGDEQDLKVFGASGATMTGIGSFATHEGVILRQLRIYHFSSKLKRMGVVVQNTENGQLWVHFKGAPEVILNKCKPGKQVDQAYNKLQDLTQFGYRILAWASKPLDSFTPDEETARSIYESQLEFQGLIVLQNKLKRSSETIIRELESKNIRTVMATGDSLLTGISIAQDCGIMNDETVYIGEYEQGQLAWNEINGDMNVTAPASLWLGHIIESKCQIAMTGKAFKALLKLQDQSLAYEVIKKAKVFARMAPEHKTILIKVLQGTTALVGMCGDGANDCGALSQADVGISLSQAEASISAPFTSKINDISCVKKVIIEGRCSLMASFANFKYIELYAMTQFVCVNMLYWFGSNLSDMQFLFIDLIVIFPLLITMARSEASPTLSSKLPPSHLISVPILFSVIGQSFLQALTLAATYGLLSGQEWYEPLRPELGTEEEADEALLCHENTVLFLISTYITIWIWMLYNFGKPFRLPFYRNRWFLTCLVSFFGFTVYLIISPLESSRWILGLTMIPIEFRFTMLFICAAYSAISWIYERCVVPQVPPCPKR